MFLLAACAAEPASPAPDPMTIFVSDYGADAIFRYDGLTGAFEGVFAEGRSQKVDRPASVRLGPDGMVYQAGFGQGDIVRFDATSGVMMDVFYRDTTLLEEPVELDFMGDELLVVGNDTMNAVVIDATGRATREFGWPLMRDAHDFVIVGDTMIVGTDSHPELGAAIQMWDLATGELVGTAGPKADLITATGLAHADGVLYACDWERDRVVAYDAATGESHGVLIDSHLQGPVSLERVGDSLLVLDRFGIHEFDAESGTYVATRVAAGDGHLDWPRSFTLVPDAALASP